MNTEEGLTRDINALAAKQTKLKQRRFKLRDEARVFGAERNELIGKRRRLRQLAAMQAQGIDLGEFSETEIAGALGTASGDGLAPED